MAYMPIGFTPEQESYLVESQGKLVTLNEDVIKRLKEEESRRKWTLVLGGVGMLFAAIKLGIVVVPTIRKRRAERIGAL
jgi:hypothetical protein